VLTIVFALLAAATNALSSVLQRKANAREAQANRTGVAGLTDLLRQRSWLLGIAAMIASFGLQAAALRSGELSEVQPLMAMELPITLLLASIAFHRKLGRRAWGGIAGMTIGMAVFLLALQPSPGQPLHATGVSWAVSTGIAGAVIVAMAVLAFLQSAARRAALLGAAAGVAFALTAVFMSAALASGVSWSLFSQWQTYLVAASGLCAVLLLQEGMQAGSLVAVQPGVTLVDPVVAVLLGVLLFQEHVRAGGWIVVEVLSAVAIGWAVVRLSRSPVPGEDQDADERRGGQVRTASGDVASEAVARDGGQAQHRSTTEG
jgi:drug/metabolite transporter (DMT)-like permease